MQKQQNIILKKSKHIVLAICLLFFVQFIYAQEPTYIHFEPEIDIPFSTTYGDIVQDSLGYIWFGTDSGLYRYDGENFMRIPAASAIKDIEVLDLKMDSSETLWYQTLDGHTCYFIQGNDSIRIFNPNGIFDSCTTLSFKLQHNKLFIKSKEKNAPLIRLHSFDTHSKEIRTQLICSAPGIFKFSFQNDTLLLPNNYSPVMKNIAKIKLQFMPKLKGDGLYFVYDQNNTLMMYNKKEIKSLFDNTLFKTIKTDSFVINNWLYKDSTVMFATNNGIIEVNSELNKKTTLSFLKNQNVYSLLIDRQNGLWVGTYGNGVFYIPSNALYNYNRTIPDGIIKILGTNLGTYIILSKNSISALNTQTLTPSTPQLFLIDRIMDGYIEKSILYVRTLKDLKIYALSSKGKTFQLISKRPMVGKKIRPIGKNKYISGTYLSLKEITGNKYQTLSTQRVTALCKDSATSSIWVGGYSGVKVWRYDTQGVKANMSIRPAIFSPTTMIEKAPDDHIWIASSTKGLFDYYNDTTTKYPFIFNGKPKRIDQISCNNPTKIWLSSYNELYFFDRKSKKYSAINNVSKTIKYPITSLYASGDTILIGTKKGLFLYFFNQKAPHTTPLVGIESVKINFKDTLVLPSYNLPYFQNNIELTFNTIGSFNPLYKPEIYYKLNEADQWHLAHNKRLSLINLASGEYNISIKSVILDSSSKDNNTKNIVFTISKPFWKTLWFYSLIFVSSSLIAIYWFSNKRKQLELARQRDKESEKLKNAVLQLQMNPHFIFNSMNTIIYYITVANKEKSIQILTKLSRLIRQIFVFSNKKLIPLSTELQFLSDYLDMEQERFAEKIVITRVIEQEAMESSFPIPPLMVQPILENSFKHGLFHKNGHGVLRFSAFFIKNGVKFVIEDDGVGRNFKKSTTQSKKTSSYDVINSRIQLINQSTEEFSDIFVQFAVIDLVDDQDKPLGTRSTITFKKKKR